MEQLNNTAIQPECESKHDWSVGPLCRSVAQTHDFQCVRRGKCKEGFDMPVALERLAQLGRECGITDFEVSARNRWAYAQIILWVMGDERMRAIDPHAPGSDGKFKVVPGNLNKGLFIAGPTGSGKTAILSLAKIMGQKAGVTFWLGERPAPKEGYYLPYRLVERKTEWITVAADDIITAASEDDRSIDVFKRRSILVIDDLMRENSDDARCWGRTHHPLREILNARGDRNDLLTIITSNFPIYSPEIVNRYSDTVASRLRGMCNFIPLICDDWR